LKKNVKAWAIFRGNWFEEKEKITSVICTEPRGGAIAGNQKGKRLFLERRGGKNKEKKKSEGGKKGTACRIKWVARKKKKGKIGKKFRGGKQDLTKRVGRMEKVGPTMEKKRKRGKKRGEKGGTSYWGGGTPETKSVGAKKGEKNGLAKDDAELQNLGHKKSNHKVRGGGLTEKEGTDTKRKKAC